MTGSAKALDYYYTHQEQINAGHLGKYVAIYDDKVEGYYDDFTDAAMAMIRDKGYPVGSYNVVQCLPGEGWVLHLSSVWFGEGK
jgi:hypothetical protein